MNYAVLVSVGIAGVALGMYLARRKEGEGFIAKQVEKKAENKQKILTFLQTNDPTSPRLHGARQIQNNDVEKLVGVSNATAERYLNELEKEGKLVQHGTIGPEVFYTLK